MNTDKLRRRTLLAALAGLLASGISGATTYELHSADVSVVGSVTRIKAESGDSFVALGRLHGVGYEELKLANPDVDPWLPGVGTDIVIPTRYVLPSGPRKGIILNVPEMRLYYFPRPGAGEVPVVMTFPVSVGRMDWKTPIGLTEVTAKVRQPTWYPPESIREEHAAHGRPLPRAVPPGPENPLGEYAMRLGIPGYLIHGTNRPAGVGMRVTHGCVRMFPEDIELVFPMIPRGERVRIVNEPFKVGQLQDSLFLEVHPPFDEDTDVVSAGLTFVTWALVAATDEPRTDVDWDAVQEIFDEAAGIPAMMTMDSALLENARAQVKLDSWCSAGSTAELCEQALTPAH